MEEIDPGHTYHLRSLDSEIAGEYVELTFVKREGPGYPGNVGHHSGTTTQEVLRALIKRAQYVNGQIADPANTQVITYLRGAIWHLEERAARRHGRPWPDASVVALAGIEDAPTCESCNHIGCEGGCH